MSVALTRRRATPSPMPGRSCSAAKGSTLGWMCHPRPYHPERVLGFPDRAGRVVAGVRLQEVGRGAPRRQHEVQRGERLLGGGARSVPASDSVVVLFRLFFFKGGFPTHSPTHGLMGRSRMGIILGQTSFRRLSASLKKTKKPNHFPLGP